MRKLVQELRRKDALLVIAESCTGGRMADQVTGVPGSSEVFWGSLVTYQERAKGAVIGVSSRLLEAKGAVSREVAVAMAEGAYRIARRSASGRAVVAVATTGVAGPSGGTRRTPVGLCYIGITSAARRGKARVIRVAPARGSRQFQKSRFTRLALEAALKEASRL